MGTSWTLETVRAQYESEVGFSSLSYDDMRHLRDWLASLADEIYQMQRALKAEFRRCGLDD